MATMTVDTITSIASLGNSKGHRGKESGESKVESRHACMIGIHLSKVFSM